MLRAVIFLLKAGGLMSNLVANVVLVNLLVFSVLSHMVITNVSYNGAK